MKKSKNPESKEVKCLIQYADVLPEKINRSLLEYVISKENSFTKTGGEAYTKIEKYQEWRKSKVLYNWDFEEYVPVFEKLIKEYFKNVCEHLRIKPFKIASIDMQLTSHNDGEQFRLHKDKSTKGNENRMITFVYYFNSSRKKFSGGELLFPETERMLIEPVNNTIVFFDPALTHEVLPVKCKSKKFKDGRFTVNGWILKGAAGK